MASLQRNIANILSSPSLQKEDLVPLLKTDSKEATEALQTLSTEVKQDNVGRIVYLRGLVEFSNICRKNCFYCGLRKGNKKVNRFRLNEKQILDAAAFAHENRFGSLVLQSGENQSKEHIDFICRVVQKIKSKYNLGLTLSCGEQTEETYRRFFNSGAHRYLLRIETSSPQLYAKWHPNDDCHRFENRLNCMMLLRKTGFQVGSGSMVGLPYQTYGDIAGDILFLRDMEVDMMGIGPFIAHSETPFYRNSDYTIPPEERLGVTLRMIALLRILLKDVNIASTTAMEVLDKSGREKGVMFGANVIMPNLTPPKQKKDYLLYEDKHTLNRHLPNKDKPRFEEEKYFFKEDNPCFEQDKPCLNENGFRHIDSLLEQITSTGDTIGYGEWGDPLHFFRRTIR